MMNIQSTGKREISKSARISPYAHICAGDIIIGDNAIIESGVSLTATRIRLGNNVRIGPGTRTITSQKVKVKDITIGDGSELWGESLIYVPLLVIGDYSVIQERVKFQGHQPLLIGHNFWVGNNVILNSTGGLEIGNSVGIGANSEVYSHGFHGELLEGCLINKSAGVGIGHNVWLSGSVSISPGVHIGDYAIVLTRSNVIKDIPSLALARGNPASVMPGIVTYKFPSLDKKTIMIQQYIREWCDELLDGYSIEAPCKDPCAMTIVRSLSGNYKFGILVIREASNIDLDSCTAAADVVDLLLITGDPCGSISVPNKVSHFSLSDKHYIKRGSKAEYLFMKHMTPLKARFIPMSV